MQVIKIKKKSGGFRVCLRQGPHDKHKYRAIAADLTARLSVLCPPDRATAYGPTDRPRVARGFMPGENAVTNAMVHVGKKFILNMDLKDFFDHCTPELILKGLTHPMGESTVKDEELARSACLKMVPDRRVVQRRDVLAARQGLSSSPAASNLAAVPMDRQIISELPDGVRYTRYADDLSFSSDNLQELLEIRERMPQIAKDNGQEVNGKKTRIQSLVFGRMSCTGVMVDSEGVHCSRAVRRKLRAAKHNARRDKNWYARAVAKGLEEWSLLKIPGGASAVQ